MILYLTQSFQNQVGKLCKKNPQLKTSFKKQLTLFERNPRHPSLKLHKLKGNRSEQFAVLIEGDLRALCIVEDGWYIFFDLVKHDQY